MKKDEKKLTAVLKSKWNDFQNSLKEYMLQMETTKGIQLIWEHFQIHLCIWKEKSELDKDEQESVLLIDNDESEIKIQEDWNKEQIFCAVRREAEYKRKEAYPVCSTYVEISSLIGFSDYMDVLNEVVKDSEGKYKVAWIGTYRETASEQEKTAIGVVLNFLKECSDNLNIIVKATAEQWQQKGTEKAFNFIQWYKGVVFSTYPFPKEQMIEDIASAKYETRENDAIIYFVDENDITEMSGNGSTGLAYFDSKCYPEYEMDKEENISSTRKMLEVCSQRKRYLLALNSKPYYLRGIVTASRFGKTANEKYSIHFMGRGEWKLCKGEEAFLLFRNKHYYTDESLVDVALDEKIRKMSCIDQDKRNKFKKIFQKLEEQPHGALMIVAEDAESETERLCSKFQRGMRIDKIELQDDDNLDLLMGMSSIDGAVMVDLNGYCYGFGVILDGVAQVKGNTGRGSRFNSSANYIAGKRRYAVIVSEDKERGIEISYGLG